MNNINFKKLNIKDKMLIMKQLEKFANDIYEDNKVFVLNQITRDAKNYKSTFGKLSKRHYTEKSIKEVIEGKKREITKLQEEIDNLKKLSPDTIIKEASDTLVAQPSSETLDIVKDLTSDIIEGLASARIMKSASKTKRG